MTTKSDVIRRFIVDLVGDHPRDIGRVVSDHFGISRQAFNRHMKTLIEDGVIESEGRTSDRIYSLRVASHNFSFPLSDFRDEDKVWREYVAPLLHGARDRILNICYYGFTEMFNNAIDHSDGTAALVEVAISAKEFGLLIADDGVGIFRKISDRFRLDDPREAVLELSKGKLTTDPERHSGQGIFFTSRMFDEFSIYSGHLLFSHRNGKHSDDDWLHEVNPLPGPGTRVSMKISTDSATTAKEVFDRYADPENDYSFSKTHVPLSLARYDGGQLVSRSQAKRVLSRFDRFQEVILDFEGIEEIGQAFADEVFRVFRNSNPGTRIKAIRASHQVRRMIDRAESPNNAPSSPPGPS